MKICLIYAGFKQKKFNDSTLVQVLDDTDEDNEKLAESFVKAIKDLDTYDWVEVVTLNVDKIEKEEK